MGLLSYCHMAKFPESFNLCGKKITILDFYDHKKRKFTLVVQNTNKISTFVIQPSHEEHQLKEKMV